jgi:hypothetical protein
MTNSHQPEANDAFYAAQFEGLDSIPAEPMLDDPWVGRVVPGGFVPPCPLTSSPEVREAWFAEWDSR